MIIGHQRQIRYLSRGLANGRMAHAYLFHGPEAVGKRTVAMALTRALLCQTRPMALGSCGQCRSCEAIRRINHPDVTLLAPGRPFGEGNSARHEIGIAQIRELERRLSLSSWEGGWRVVIIDGAEMLSSEAQSSLLKTLEEPADRTVFFLITSAPELLFETIRSRSVPMHFSPVAEPELRQALRDAFPRAKLRLGEILRLANGRPGLALRFAAEPEVLAGAKAARERYRRLLDQSLDLQFRFAESAAERGPEELESFFEFCLSSFRDELIHDPSAPVRSAGTLRLAASSLELLAGTAVNRRLLLSAFFITLLALRQP